MLQTNAGGQRITPLLREAAFVACIAACCVTQTKTIAFVRVASQYIWPVLHGKTCVGRVLAPMGEQSVVIVVVCVCVCVLGEGALY